MSYLRNDAINRVNLHSAIQALAQGAGGIFFLVFLLRAGISVPVALLFQVAIHAARFALRPAILPLGKRFGLKPLVIAGALFLALQYPVLAEVNGIDTPLAVLCAVAAVGEILYWPSYNAYFAALGDAEHRGHQIGAREALIAIVNMVAPILGTWALVDLGPRSMFALVGVVQAFAIVPLIRTPNVSVKQTATGMFRASHLGVILYASDGWFDAWFILVWQIALFVSLGQSFADYGGAMTLAAVAGAAGSLVLGRLVDAGHGRRAALVGYTLAGIAVIVRAASFGSPWLAIVANAAGALVLPIMLPALGAATYNLAKASPCPLRFAIVAEAGWDVGCATALLVAAALAAAGVPLPYTMLLALPVVAGAAFVLRRYYERRGRTPAAIEPAVLTPPS